MKPQEALRQSELRTIRAAVPGGVGVIHQSRAETGSFHARVVRRDESGQLRMSCMEVVGDFDSLADAVAALNQATDSNLDDWHPEIGVDLRLGHEGGMQPSVRSQS